MNLLGHLGSLQTQQEVWRTRFVNQEIPRLAGKMAIETSQKEAAYELHDSHQTLLLDVHCCHFQCHQHWILTATAVTLNHFPTFPISLHLSSPRESRSDWLNQRLFCLSSRCQQVGRKSVWWGPIPYQDSFSVCFMKQEGRLHVGVEGRQIEVFMHKFFAYISSGYHLGIDSWYQSHNTKMYEILKLLYPLPALLF